MFFRLFFVTKSFNNKILVDIVQNFIIEYYLNVTKFFDSKLKNSIIKNINEFRRPLPSLEESKLPHNISFIFHGKPQTGKTSIVHIIAQIYDMTIYLINVKVDIMSQIANIPNNSMILFENIDDINADTLEDTDAMYSILNNETSLNKCIVIMTTIHYNMLRTGLKYGKRTQFNYEFKKSL